MYTERQVEEKARELAGGFNQYANLSQAERAGFRLIARDALTNQAVMAELEEILEYFEDREDTVDGSYGEPEANTEMQFAGRIRRLMKHLEER